MACDATAERAAARSVQLLTRQLDESNPVTPPPSRTKWTRCVPHPVLIGHAASLSQVLTAISDAMTAQGKAEERAAAAVTPAERRAAQADADAIASRKDALTRELQVAAPLPIPRAPRSRRGRDSGAASARDCELRCAGAVRALSAADRRASHPGAFRGQLEMR